MKEFMQKYSKILNFYPFVVIGLTVILLCFCFIKEKGENTQFSLPSDMPFDTWYLEGSDYIELPYDLRSVNGKPIVLKTTIPSEVGDGYGVMLRSSYCRVEGYVDEAPIGSYGSVLPLPFGSMVGNIRVILPIGADDAGKQLKIRIVPYFSQHMDIPEIEYGPMDSLKYTVLRENLFRLCVCVFLVTILLFTVAIALYQRLSEQVIALDVLGYFFGFVLGVLCWIICSSDLPQFVTSANESVCLVSFFSLSMMAIPYMGFCEKVLPTGRKVFMALYLLGWLNPLFQLICLVFHIADPLTLLPITHVYIICAVVSSIWFAIKQMHNDFAAWLILVSSVVLALCAVAGLICFAVAPSMGYDAIAFSVGLVMFILALFWLILYRQIGYIQEQKFMETYKRMAYMDVLTGMANRAAMEQQFDEIHKRLGPGDVITYLMFDMNYLKETNDKEGHQAGDRMLIALGECLEEAFGSLGKCYRLGGDEFAVIIENDRLSEGELRRIFEETLFNHNRYHRNMVSSAMGYASMKYDSEAHYFNALAKAADESMYEDKKRWHADDAVR